MISSYDGMQKCKSPPFTRRSYVARVMSLVSRRDLLIIRQTDELTSLACPSEGLKSPYSVTRVFLMGDGL